MINSSNLQSLLILIFVGMEYKLNGANTSTDTFARMTAIMNSVDMAGLFEAMCHNILKHLLVTGSKNGELLGSISSYFHKVEINSQRMLLLYYLVWFCTAFYITQLCKRL